MKSVIVLENEFNNFFESLGFQKVSVLAGHAPKFQNADYINTKERILFELKIIDNDYFFDGGVIDRFHSFVANPKDINNDGLGLYMVDWPQKNREGKCDTFEEPLRRTLKKANRQLKETNQHLLSGEGKGFLCIALHGFQSLHPDTVYRMLQELLTFEFSSITGFLMCMPTWANYKETGELAHPLAYISINCSSTQNIDNYLENICISWLDFMAAGGHKSE